MFSYYYFENKTIIILPNNLYTPNLFCFKIVTKHFKFHGHLLLWDEVDKSKRDLEKEKGNKVKKIKERRAEWRRKDKNGRERRWWKWRVFGYIRILDPWTKMSQLIPDPINTDRVKSIHISRFVSRFYFLLFFGWAWTFWPCVIVLGIWLL